MRTELFSDSEIIDILLNNQDIDAAVRFLYRSYYQSTANYVLVNNGSWEDAQDIFQETILAFINLVKAGKFRGESTIKTFLYSVNRNLWLNELKKRNRSQARELKYEQASDKSESSANEALEMKEMNNELAKTMEMLGETCKKILLAFYYENLSMKEILTNLNYQNEQVVRNKKYKCLKQLEELVSENKNLYHQLKTLLHA